MFICIVSAIFGLQILLITFCGRPFGVYSHFGLHPIHWLMSVLNFLFQIAIGAISLITSFLLKLLPANIFPSKGK